MSTPSELGYFVRWDPTSRFATDDPLGARETRYGVVNNLHHLQGMAGQPRVSFLAQDGGFSGQTTTILRVPSAADTYEWLTGYEFVATRKANGAAYRLVYDLGGSCDGGTATFRVQLWPGNELPRLTTWADFEELSTSSSSPAWLTPSGSGDNVLETRDFGRGYGWLDHTAIERWPTEFYAGDSYVSSEVLLLRLDVYVKNTTTKSVRMQGFVARELY